MSTRTYPLNWGGAKRLEITSSADFKNTIVRLDGNLIGSLPTKQELESGKGFPLGDGSMVHVQLTGNAWSGRRIEVERDGRPLPGSPSDPYRKLRAASIAVFFIAGVSLLLGGLLTLFSYTQDQGIGLGSLIGGVLYLVLGFFVRRKSKIALGIAVAVYALNLVVFVIESVIGANCFGIVGIAVGISLLTVMSRGFRAIDSIRTEEGTLQRQAV